MHSKNQTVSTSANGPNSKISRPTPLTAAVTHSVHIILASISPCPLTPRGCDKRYSSPEYFRDSGRGIMATSEKKRTRQTKVREGPPPVASPPKRKPWMNAVRDILPTQTETDASRGSRGSRSSPEPVNVEQGGQSNILEEAEEYLAQCLIIFLYADLRLLSATGRISTKYETLHIASDEARKTSAGHLAGISDDHASLLVGERTNPGISPSQIMAVLMIELRKEVLAWRKTRKFEEETSIMSTLFDKKNRKKIEDDMHAQLRCYNLMVGSDLKSSMPQFTATEQPVMFRGTKELVERLRNKRSNPYIPEEPERSDAETRSEEKKSAMDNKAGVSSAEYSELEPHSPPQPLARHKSLPVSLSGLEEPTDSKSDSGLEMPPPPPPTWAGSVRPVSKRVQNMNLEFQKRREKVQLDLQKRRETVQLDLQKRREFVQHAVQRQKEVINQGEDAVARHEIEDVGDAFVRLAQEGTPGGTIRRNLSEEDLLDYMEQCVESREFGRLDFMSGFFRDGSVSQVMAKSEARVVWLNDWYPLKDCTYGISVDKKRKRVLLVFRGAITRADWAHAGKMDLKKVENPIQDKSLPKHIYVHNGFDRFLFRVRKDTGTRKYDEIATVLHHCAASLGKDYKIVLTGYSLGGALSTLFSLYASTDERFVKNGPIQIYSFGCPYVGGLTFYETFRHQEKARKIQVGRFFNTRDSISHLPVSWTGQYQHVGVSVRLPRVRPQFRAFIPEYLPRPSYPKDATRFGFYLRALRENYFFNLPFPWKIRKRHSLDEHQKRMLRARALCGLRKDRNGNEIQNQTLNDLYVALVYKDDA